MARKARRWENGDCVSCFRTPLGWIAILGQGHELRSVAVGYPSKESARRGVAGPFAGPLCEGPVPEGRWNERLVERLQDYAAGNASDAFLDIRIDLSGTTLFQRLVLTACRQVRSGQTISYGELADRAGFPGAARAAGSVMARNRFPLIVPCHRIVSSGGGLGGYSAPDGLQMKCRLLELERAFVAGAHTDRSGPAGAGVSSGAVRFSSSRDSAPVLLRSERTRAVRSTALR
jgi:methylated-DNA-[protein]-cysteine S-methyltransferase